jgi:hypothetical protein
VVPGLLLQVTGEVRRPCGDGRRRRRRCRRGVWQAARPLPAETVAVRRWRRGTAGLRCGGT